MSLFRTGTLVVATMCVSTAAAFAESGPCTSAGCADSFRLSCQAECKIVKVTRHCFETECKPICIPPVTLPCCRLKKLFGGAGNDECSDDACRRNGLLHRLCSKLTAGRIRHVNTYSKKEYECGTKCVCEWKVVCRGAGCCELGCCNDGSLCTP
ncbi:MAG TPA: hypothetical protein EYG03_22090 [Planctomycetes bacterium]|nr:hypothetical protein [Planctomycetota bacterium]